MSEARSTIQPVSKDVSRVLYEKYNGADVPCVVVFCGIHGNEQAGLKAVSRMMDTLNAMELKGSLYILSGNIPAILKDRRFIDRDLNRVWSRKLFTSEPTPGLQVSEYRDRRELLSIISDISDHVNGPLYFIDIHTTSAASIPFITIDDALINRRFTAVFPVPVVLGIEEYLQGALLSFINQLGFVSLGFEAGSHDAEQSVNNAESFLWLALDVAGVVPLSEEEVRGHRKALADITRGYQNFYEVTYRYALTSGEDFRMEPGFQNFQPIEEGVLLAQSEGKELRAPRTTTIFMPLYQQQGEDGYFFVRRVPYWLLKLSASFRLLRLDSALTVLPGISWIDNSKNGLRVDLKVARYLAKSFFHLLGYREVREDMDHLLVYNRERVSQKERYPFRYPKP